MDFQTKHPLTHLYTKSWLVALTTKRCLQYMILPYWLRHRCVYILLKKLFLCHVEHLGHVLRIFQTLQASRFLDNFIGIIQVLLNPVFQKVLCWTIRGWHAAMPNLKEFLIPLRPLNVWTMELQIHTSWLFIKLSTDSPTCLAQTTLTDSIVPTNTKDVLCCCNEALAIQGEKRSRNKVYVLFPIEMKNVYSR